MEVADGVWENGDEVWSRRYARYVGLYFCVLVDAITFCTWLELAS